MSLLSDALGVAQHYFDQAYSDMPERQAPNSLQEFQIGCIDKIHEAESELAQAIAERDRAARALEEAERALSFVRHHAKMVDTLTIEEGDVMTVIDIIESTSQQALERIGEIKRGATPSDATNGQHQ